MTPQEERQLRGLRWTAKHIESKLNSILGTDSKPLPTYDLDGPTGPLKLTSNRAQAIENRIDVVEKKTHQMDQIISNIIKDIEKFYDHQNELATRQETAKVEFESFRKVVNKLFTPTDDPTKADEQRALRASAENHGTLYTKKDIEYIREAWTTFLFTTARHLGRTPYAIGCKTINLHKENLLPLYNDANMKY